MAGRFGQDSISITEHHLINILMMPAPLQFAVKIASKTSRVKIIIAVAVLPLHDKRKFTGDLGGGYNPRLNRLIDPELPNSKLVILKGLKHSLLVDAPERVLPHIKSFLLSHS